MLESPTLVRFGNFYYLFYNLSRIGEHYRIGESPTGPWGESIHFQPGWAHEIWQDPRGN
jgi:hypothetical protein